MFSDLMQVIKCILIEQPSNNLVLVQTVSYSYHCAFHATLEGWLALMLAIQSRVTNAKVSSPWHSICNFADGIGARLIGAALSAGCIRTERQHCNVPSVLGMRRRPTRSGRATTAPLTASSSTGLPTGSSTSSSTSEHKVHPCLLTSMDCLTAVQ